MVFSRNSEERASNNQRERVARFRERRVLAIELAHRQQAFDDRILEVERECRDEHGDARRGGRKNDPRGCRTGRPSPRCAPAASRALLAVGAAATRAATAARAAVLHRRGGYIVLDCTFRLARDPKTGLLSLLHIFLIEKRLMRPSQASPLSSSLTGESYWSVHRP